MSTTIPNPARLPRALKTMALATGFLLLSNVIPYAQDNSNRPAGTVVAWGRNNLGQTIVPEGLTDVVSVAMGSSHSLALKADGTVVAWGNDFLGRSTVPDGLRDVVAIAASRSTSFALKRDGTVVAWGDDDWGIGTIPAGLRDVSAIATDRTSAVHAAALRSDGTVVVWGYTDPGWDEDTSLITTVPPGLTGVVDIGVGYKHVLALKNDGTVVTWGINYIDRIDGTQLAVLGALPPPAGLSGVVSIAAGYNHNLALKADGTVVAWGNDQIGQSTVPEGLNGVVAIAAGIESSLALKSDGTVVAWGSSAGAPVPDGLKDVSAIDLAGGHFRSSALALRRDGTVVAWGHEEHGRTDVPAGLTGVFAILAGAHNLAIVAPPAPTLAAYYTENQLRLSWLGSASGYRVEVTNDLSNPESWTVDPSIPVLLDSNYVLTVDAVGAGRFYRLKRE